MVCRVWRTSTLTHYYLLTWMAEAAAFLAASMAAGLPPSMPMTFSSAALAESPLTTWSEVR